MKRKILFLLLAGILVLVAGCSQDSLTTAPGPVANQLPADKDGSENLGVPLIPIASGTAFAEGGVGVTAVGTGVLTIDVPQGPAIAQVLLYWSGASTVALGDDTIELDGVSVQGDLIGGPTLFYNSAAGPIYSTAYRADITGLGIIAAGTNSITVSGLDFDPNPGTNEEDDGCSIVVILDDGSASELSLRDGLDMAFFGFQPTLDRTEPQVFTVTPSALNRTADLMMVVASVGENRPTTIEVTTSTGTETFTNVLNSTDGPTWDSLVLPIQIPANDTSVTVEVVSTNTQNPTGASLGWVAAGLAVALPAPPADTELAGTVFVDANNNGLQDDGEWGIPDVVVDFVDPYGNAGSAVTAADGSYLFAGPAGPYTVEINLTPGVTFNDDLAASFTPTTALIVSATSPATGIDFGFVPAVEDILTDLGDGTIISEGHDRAYWIKTIRRALRARHCDCESRDRDENDRSGRNHQGRGRDGDDDRDDDHGRGHHHCNYDGPSRELVKTWLIQLEGLYLPEPYQLRDGKELKHALRILRKRPRNNDQKLFQELFVTELNYVSGSGLVGETDRLGVLISWGESLLASEDEGKSAEKGRFNDVIDAISIFEAINTGGGGGVDE